MKKIIAILFFIMLIVPLWSENIRITQVDTGNLLLSGEIDIYFSMTGFENKNIKAGDFTAREAGTGDLDIKSLEANPGRESGINFILLIDNSGSMYEESYQGSRRIAQAKLALASFLDQIDPAVDKVGVYSFNTDLEELAPPGADISAARKSLSKLEEPEPGMAYTELYNSLKEAAGLFPRSTGRRAVIVLSDGENYSLFEKTGKESGMWGTASAGPENIITSFLENGVTLDGINLSDDMDTGLSGICDSAGGAFHDVRSTEDIAAVYTEIRERISGEYRLTVKAPLLPEGTGKISLRYMGSGDSRDIFVPVLFGGASELPVIISVILALLGLAGLVVLCLIPFEKPVKNAQIQGLNSGGKTVLSEGVTVIGTSPDAHYSMAGTPGVDPEHATIVCDEKDGSFTLVSRRPVRVNNRKVKNRKLTPGDVIRIEGSTIIFDAPDATELR